MSFLIVVAMGLILLAVSFYTYSLYAAAKNWPSVAVLPTPLAYEDFIDRTHKQNGTTLEQRFELAQIALETVAEYRTRIAAHFGELDFETNVLPGLTIKGAD